MHCASKNVSFSASIKTCIRYDKFDTKFARRKFGVGMKLKSLLTGLDGKLHGGSKPVDITGVSSHSSLIVPGNLFIAKGRGVDYIDKAIATGASAVVTDIYNPFLPIAQFVCKDPGKIEGELAKRFYKDPSHKLKVAAVTGTNGKTTTAYMVRHILNRAKIKAGMIGTIEYDTGIHTHPATLTTPDVVATTKMFAEMVRNGCEAAVIEASSHGLEQGRLDGVTIEAAGFTNLSRDHLDFHSSMDAYAHAKSKLFKLVKKQGRSVINADDTRFPVMRDASKAPFVLFGQNSDVDVRIELAEASIEGTTFYLHNSGKKLKGFVPVPGVHNVYNATCAILLSVSLGVPLDKAIRVLKSFSGVPGRLEKVPGNIPFHVFVDFAHTEDALKHVLATMKPLCKKRLIVIFGCGGDRDQGKRPNMARVVESFADYAIITSDNPRTEDPATICRMVEAGMSGKCSYEVLVEREAAIEKAMQIAKPDDVVLIAGRGHEPRQSFGSYSVPFVDALVAKQYIDEFQTVGV